MRGVACPLSLSKKGGVSYLCCACIHQGAVLGALEHIHLCSCFLKCVDKFKGCQDIYLQKHYCTHPSNMTHPYIETVACAVVVLCTYLVFAYPSWQFMAIVNPNPNPCHERLVP